MPAAVTAVAGAPVPAGVPVVWEAALPAAGSAVACAFGPWIIPVCGGPLLPAAAAGTVNADAGVPGPAGVLVDGTLCFVSIPVGGGAPVPAAGTVGAGAGVPVPAGVPSPSHFFRFAGTHV